MLTKELNTTDRPQLAFIEPMQVAPVRELPDGGNWTYEVKFDGYRCLAGKRSNVSPSGPAAVTALLPGFEK